MTEFLVPDGCSRPLQCESAKYCLHNCRLYNMGGLFKGLPEGTTDDEATVHTIAAQLVENARSYKGLTTESLNLEGCTKPRHVVIVGVSFTDELVKLKLTIRFRFNNVTDCPLYYVYGYGDTARTAWRDCIANINKNVMKVDKFAGSQSR